MDEEVNIKDYLAVIIKRWYFIVLSVVALLAVLWWPQLSAQKPFAPIRPRLAAVLPFSLA